MITLSSISEIYSNLDNHFVQCIDGDFETEKENEKSEDDTKIVSPFLDLESSGLNSHAFCYHHPLFYKQIDLGTDIQPPELG
ncbi:hypothetical protein N8368_02375 [Bacteroidia bacterium]|nr:hypothetical protein [Bacteroidia bacterium]MDC1395334.1 hypothetical protein [Bacteroidia bacterium]